MTRILGVLVTALLLAAPSAFAGELTLRDVIELHRSGLGDDLLIAVIDADGGPITLSLADVHDLKSDGFSERLIAALVRTGARRAVSVDDGSTPVGHVQQEVTNYVVPAIVVVATPGPFQRHRDHGDRDEPGRRTHLDDNDFRHRPPSPPPPAMWVTRREDGKNVTASGVVRKSVPAAWVTPRDPRVDEKKVDENPPVEGKPRPR